MALSQDTGVCVKLGFTLLVSASLCEASSPPSSFPSQVPELQCSPLRWGTWHSPLEGREDPVVKGSRPEPGTGRRSVM